MLPIVASIVANLIDNGMHKVADQVIEKGVDAVQDKLGMELKPQGQATLSTTPSFRKRPTGTPSSWLLLMKSLPNVLLICSYLR